MIVNHNFSSLMIVYDTNTLVADEGRSPTNDNNQFLLRQSE